MLTKLRISEDSTM